MGSSRMAALAVLQNTRRNGTFTEDTLNAAAVKNALDGRDTALTAAIVLGVLQNSYLLDYYIDYYNTSKSTKLQPLVRDILRLSAYQLVFMDKIPASAAVNEGVSLCKTSSITKAAPLVNAILRRIAENSAALPEIKLADGIQTISIKYSVPVWLADYVAGRVGKGGAERFFAYCNLKPRLHLQVNTLKADPAELAQSLGAVQSEILPDCLVSEKSGSFLVTTPEFCEGRFYVQDISSRLAVMAAGIRQGDRVLDACASPGGKSFAAAISSAGKAEITSCDISDKKTKLISDGAKRLGLDNIKVQVADAKALNPAWEAFFDVVVTDVPCSGFGVIARKPEIRYKNPEDITSLPKIQSSILQNCSSYVKPGGTLVYSTCTILQEENEMVVSAFLEKNPDFSACDFELCGLFNSRDGMLTLWPQLHGTDGFFVARMRRAL